MNKKSSKPTPVLVKQEHDYSIHLNKQINSKINVLFSYQIKQTYPSWLLSD